MVAMIDSVIQKSQIYYTRLSKWKNKADFKIQTGPYVLQMAKSKEQVLECFKLRYEVFCKEMAGSTKKTGLDYDKYDNFCDHLIIVHEPTQKIVGTYRMNFSKTSEIFYTESEFEITNWITEQSSAFIELGRACIHSEHRRGIVISLLWRGIAEYMKMMGAETLIGCSSIKVTDARSAALVFKYFEMNDAIYTEIFNSREKYQMKDLLFWLMVFSKGLTDAQVAEAEEKVPSLLKSYIKAGAKIASYPAYDKEFRCIDFVTILNRADMDQKLVKKFSIK
jgi:putative hemolysin